MNTGQLPVVGQDSMNVLILADGSRVHLDDIQTMAEGQRHLDELDDAILHIESQVADTKSGRRQAPDEDWSRRVGIALKRKRRVRPRLQQRIGDLRKAERQTAVKVKGPEIRPDREERRVAFIDAAEEVLDRDLFLAIWDRAKEMRPSVFQGAQS